jgi:hypothetical protein
VFDVLSVAFVMSRNPVGEYIGMFTSTIWGGFFKRKSPKELFFLQSGLQFGGNLFIEEGLAKPDSLDLQSSKEYREELGGTLSTLLVPILINLHRPPSLSNQIG